MYINDASECARVFECAVRQFEGAFARARAADNNWPTSGRGAGVTTRSSAALHLYITIFYAQAVVVIDTYSKTLNDINDATPPAAGLISLTASSSRRGAKRGLPRAATLQEFPAFQRKVVAIPAARPEQHLFDARHILSEAVEKKSKMHERDDGVLRSKENEEN